eukprot:5199646-Pleurochrysis_carterae.AAC.2
MSSQCVSLRLSRVLRLLVHVQAKRFCRASVRSSPRAGFLAKCFADAWKSSEGTSDASPLVELRCSDSLHGFFRNGARSIAWHLCMETFGIEKKLLRKYMCQGLLLLNNSSRSYDQTGTNARCSLAE